MKAHEFAIPFLKHTSSYLFYDCGAVKHFDMKRTAHLPVSYVMLVLWMR